jgi:hypothetical protein
MTIVRTDEPHHVDIGSQLPAARIASLAQDAPPAEVGASVVAMLQMRGLCGADIDLSAGMIAP